MKCALITTHQVEAGIRALSGLLINEGLPSPVMVNLSTGPDTFPKKYPDAVKKQMLDLVLERQCQCLCFSIVDLFYDRTVDLIEHLRSNTKLPVIVGGIHAELYPEAIFKIEAVDAVCVGEAYTSFVYLIRNWENRLSLDVADFWFKNADGSIRKNRISEFYHGEMFRNIPIPDFSYSNYFLLDGGIIRDISSTPDAGPLKVEQHQIGHPGSVIYSAMGGCSNRCSFCNLTAQVERRKSFSPHPRRFRQKPMAIVKRELEALVKYNKNMKFLCIMENDFTCRQERQLKEYCELIRTICGVPFYTMVTPNTLSEGKLAAMVECGLKEINMGVQSNSSFNSQYYDRHIPDDKISDTVTMIHKYAEALNPFYDFINFNPEEPNDSLVATIDLIKTFPLPFDMVIHHLTLGEELGLYKRLIAEARIPGNEVKMTAYSDYHNLDFDGYREWDTLYLNLLLEWFAGPHDDEYAGRIPKNISRLLTTPFGKRLVAENKIKEIVNNHNGDIFSLFSRELFQMLNSHKSLPLLRDLTCLLPPVRYTNQLQVALALGRGY